MSIIKGSSYWLLCEGEGKNLRVEYFDRKNEFLWSELLGDGHVEKVGDLDDSTGITREGEQYVKAKLDPETKGKATVQTLNVVDLMGLPYYFLRFDVSHTIGSLVYPRTEPVNPGAVVRYIHEHQEQIKVFFDPQLSAAEAFRMDSFATAEFRFRVSGPC